MLDKLTVLNDMGYRFYFQFTLTPYDKTVEIGLPQKTELIRTFIELSRRIGGERLVWRYDPVFIDAAHCVQWHLTRFSQMCETLHTYTRRCILSFMDVYRNNRAHFRTVTEDEMRLIAKGFSDIADKYRLALFTCAENIDLSAFNIRHSSCVDKGIIEKAIRCPITAKRDANQRPSCRCIESVDIGAYDTCARGCAYCYGTFSRQAAAKRAAAHDFKAPMLTGWPKGDEAVIERAARSQKAAQLSLL